MRILHVIAQKPEHTGSGIFVGSIIAEAATAGCEQALIAGISIKDVSNLCSEYEEKGVLFLPVLFETEELPFPVPGMSDVMPYSSTRYRDMDATMLSQWELAFEEKLVSTIKLFQPDLILSHHLWLLSVLVVRVAEDTPVICVCHGTDLRQMELCPALGATAEEGFHKVCRVLALTQPQVNEIIQNYQIDERKISVIGAAYNSSLFFPLQKKDRKQIRVVFAGKLSFAKGVLSLINAFELLPDRLPMINFTSQPILEKEIRSVQLMLIGSGSGIEKESIERSVKNSKTNIVMTGGISQLQVSELFRNADLFVLPSFYEGLPLVVLEAIASGLRVVVTELPGLKQWIDEKLLDCGAITFVRMPEMKSVDEPEHNARKEFELQLAQAMHDQLCQIMENKDLPNEEISNVMSHHTWSAMYQKILNIMTEVCVAEKSSGCTEKVVMSALE